MNKTLRERTIVILEEAERMNPGKWLAHSRNVAEAARIIATHHPDLDPEKAYQFGALHDIGRREGIMGMQHILVGYRYLSEIGLNKAARICLTHSYPLKDVRSGSSFFDGTQEDIQFVVDFLNKITFDEYDRLIQLCDALAVADGFIMLEKRMVNTVLRYGEDSQTPLKWTVRKWQALFSIKENFEKVIGTDLYDLLPGVRESTFEIRLPTRIHKKKNGGVPLV